MCVSERERDIERKVYRERERKGEKERERQIKDAREKERKRELSCCYPLLLLKSSTAGNKNS